MNEIEPHIRSILREPLQDRILKRDDFFLLISEGIEGQHYRLTNWVKSRVFFNADVEKFEIDKVVEKIEMLCLEHLLNLLDGKKQHHEFSFTEKMSLYSYSLHVARKHNVKVKALNDVTHLKVDKSSGAKNSEKEMLLFATPLDNVSRGHDSEGNNIQEPKYWTEGVSEQIPPEVIGSLVKLESLNDIKKASLVLYCFMPSKPTIEEFNELAEKVKLSKAARNVYRNRLQSVLALRRSGKNHDIRMNELTMILDINEKKVRNLLSEIKRELGYESSADEQLKQRRQSI